MVPERVKARLLASLTETADGCLESTYSCGSHGYVQIGWGENGATRMTVGHRVAWEAEHGPIPLGLTIDHLCRNRRCCNVEHLQLMTLAENGRNTFVAMRMTCRRGHPYDSKNTYRRPGSNKRLCRACASLRRQERRAAT